MNGIDKRVFATVLIGVALACTGLSGCKQEGHGETAGKKVDEAVDKTGKALDKAGAEVGKAVEKTGEAVEKAGDKVEDAAKRNK
jgi:hyperosmotically inducible protein